MDMEMFHREFDATEDVKGGGWHWRLCEYCDERLIVKLEGCSDTLMGCTIEACKAYMTLMTVPRDQLRLADRDGDSYDIVLLS